MRAGVKKNPEYIETNERSDNRDATWIYEDVVFKERCAPFLRGVSLTLPSLTNIWQKASSEAQLYSNIFPECSTLTASQILV